MKTKLKKILIILTISLQVISLAGFFWYTDRIDRRYSDILQKETKNLQLLQGWTHSSNQKFIDISALIQDADNLTGDSLQTIFNSMYPPTNNFLDSIIENSDLSKDLDISLKKLETARNLYIHDLSSMLPEIKVNKKDGELAFRTKVKPAFEEYQDALNEFTEEYFNKITSLNKKISKDISHVSTGLILLGFSPVILSVLFILIQLVILGLLLWMFKDMDWDR